MNRILNGWLALVVAVVVWGPMSACAGVVLAEHTWDTPGDLEGWESAEAGVTTLSNDDGYLRVSFDELAVPAPGMDSDVLHTGLGSDPGFSGDFSTPPNTTIDFVFFAEDFSPDTLAVQFYANSHLWTLDLTPPAAGAWTGYQVSLDYQSGWYDGPGSDEAMFLDDLDSVEWFGIMIGRDYDCDTCGTSLAQDYGIDNVRRGFTVPEPGVGLVLGTGLLSSLWTIVPRRRRGKASPPPV